MKQITILFLLSLLLLFYSCTKSITNPESLFSELKIQYAKTQTENKKIDSLLDDGMGITIYDINHIYSKDLLCELTLYSTMGQTNFLCYKKINNNTWIIEEIAKIYNSPYAVDDLYQNEKYYYEYNKKITKRFNSETKKFDLDQQPSDFSAVPNVENIEYVINTITNSIK